MKTLLLILALVGFAACATTGPKRPAGIPRDCVKWSCMFPDRECTCEARTNACKEQQP